MYNHGRIMETNTSGAWVTFSRAGSAGVPAISGLDRR